MPHILHPVRLSSAGAPDRHRSLVRGFARLGRLAAFPSMLLAAAPSIAWADVSASPSAPPGANGLQDLLNWTLYSGCIACAATCIYGFAKMGLSHTQQSYQGSNHGKSVAILGFAGALGLGLTPTIVNALTAIH